MAKSKPLLSPSESLKKLTVSPESIKKLADFSSGLLAHVKSYYNPSLWSPGLSSPAAAREGPPPGFQTLPAALPSAAGQPKVPEST